MPGASNPEANSLGDVLEAAILELLATRGRGKTICPSEAARLVANNQGGTRWAGTPWEELMEPVRDAARRLVAEGTILITQHGRPVNLSTSRGPIRIRLR